MSADSYDLRIDQGADWVWTIRWKVGSTARNTVPKNTTGYTARMQIREKYTSPTALITLTTENSGIQIGTDGSFQVHITATQSSAMPSGNFVYDIEAVDPEGFVTKLVRGKVRVIPEVTK